MRRQIFWGVLTVLVFSLIGSARSSLANPTSVLTERKLPIIESSQVGPVLIKTVHEANAWSQKHPYWHVLNQSAGTAYVKQHPEGNWTRLEFQLKGCRKSPVPLDFPA